MKQYKEWVDPNDQGGHYDLIGIFAQAQQDFPDGVGVKRSLFAKRIAVGSKELEKCTRPELKKIINQLRAEYLLMKSKRGETVEKDTDEQ